MKKLLTLFIAAALSVNAMAQEQEQELEQGFFGNKFWDNWYIGVNGGVGTATTHQPLLQNLNPNAGLRVGKLFTPVFGLGIEANAYFSNRTNGVDMSTGSFIRYHQLGLYTTVNLINAIKGYYGEPRKFGIDAVIGFAWGHNYGNYNYGAKMNTLVNKLGFDFCYNFGKKMDWTLYLEPTINYVIAGTRNEQFDANGMPIGNKLVQYNINSSFLQLNLGIVYRFKTSNGTHNFAIAESCDQMQINKLNDDLNELRKKINDDEEMFVSLQKKRDELEQTYEACQTPVTTTKAVLKEPDLPAVFYPLNKSYITPAQQPNVAIAAEVMKNNPEYDVHIKGYASPEGPHDNNTSLGIRRANAVKDMLIKKYKIDPKRITAEGCGETDELFPIYEFNRVAVMLLKKREQ